MLILVLILLIAICFVLHCFFIDFFFNFIRQYLFSLKSCFFVFSGLLLIRLLYPGYKSEKLARVDFEFFFKAFFKNNFFALLFIG
jgi:hypothetical protein